MMRQPAPKFIFGAGEMADHVVRLLEWQGMPTTGIELFDDGFPSRAAGPANLPVVGTMRDGIERLAKNPQPAVIAIGTKGAAFRYALYRSLKAAGVPLVSVVHPSLVLAPGARFAENSIVLSGCTLAKNATLAPLCFCSTNATIEHDNVVDENAFIGPAVVTGGHVTIGRHAFVGVGAVISAGVKIGERALVGAGAVVVDDIPAGVVAIGVPARAVRDVTAGMDAPTLDDLRKLGCEP